MLQSRSQMDWVCSAPGSALSPRGERRPPAPGSAVPSRLFRYLARSGYVLLPITELGMIGFVAEVCVHEFLPRGTRRSAVRLAGDEDCIEPLQDIGIVNPKHPALLCRLIPVENPQTNRGSAGVRKLSPGLEGMRPV